MIFTIPFDTEYDIQIEELYRASGRKKKWKISLLPKKPGAKINFPPMEERDKFWLKKSFRETFRNELIKFVKSFAPKSQDKSEIFNNRDRVDRIVAVLCTEIETTLQEYMDSLRNAQWKQMQFNPEMYDSIVEFLADLNGTDTDRIRDWIEQERLAAKQKSKKKNVEITPEEVAGKLLFMNPPKKPLKFFHNKLLEILQVHKMLFADLTTKTSEHRFREEFLICLATVLSYWIGRDPKWVLLVGPSRNFKSTHINDFQLLNTIITFEVDMMTTNALISGAEDADSFMWLLNEKTQLMDEMGTLLSMRRDQVVKLLSEYCVAYKGWSTKISGSAKGHEMVRSRYNWLAGITTEKFNEMYDLFRTIGSRFITFEFPVYEDKYYHALIDKKNAAVVKSKENALKSMVASYIYGFYKWLKNKTTSGGGFIIDTSGVDDILKKVSNFYTLFRNGEPPLWMRTQLTDLATTIALMHDRKKVTVDDIEILISACYSCNKRYVVELVKFFAANGFGNSSDVSKVMTNHQKRFLTNRMINMASSGFLEERGDGFVVRKEWKEVMDIIKRNMKRCGEYEKYHLSAAGPADEFIPYTGGNLY